MFKTYDHTNCKYTLLDNNIHHLYFSNSNRDSTDAFFEILTDIYDASDTTPLRPGEKIKILFETAQGELPMMYSFSVYRNWRTTRAAHHPIRFGILSESQVLMPLINSLIRALPTGHAQTRFFKPAQTNDAIAWLLLNNA